MTTTDSHSKTTKGQLHLTPVPGNWYVDKAGSLFKVKALVFEFGQADHVIVDYPRGVRRKIALSLWQKYIHQSSTPIPGHQGQA